MREQELLFSIGENLRVDGKNYTVKGKIDFRNEADNYHWTEYMLVSTSDKDNVKWLSIDPVYREYAIYTVCRKTTEDEIIRQGYHEVDQGIAKVVGSSGDVDTDYGETVGFKEFEDKTEEKIMSIETWEDEVEYSSGYYLDAEEIERIGGDYQGAVNGSGQFNRGGYKTKKTLGTVWNGILWIIVIFGMIAGFGGMPQIGTVNLVKEIKKDSSFNYVTSITADIDNKQKADIYQTNLSIEVAAKAILRLADTSVVSVDEESEEGSVAIITKKNYCIVYTSDEGNTMVQVSTRKYVYNSRQDVYHGSNRISRFYRGYYYTNAFSDDEGKYKGVNAYENYDGATYYTDANNNYQSYSDTIKQESIAARQSSGGGTNSGK